MIPRDGPRARRGVALSLAAALVTTIAVAACRPPAGGGGVEDGRGLRRFTLEVAEATVACMGIAPMQCLLVRTLPDKTWKRFFDPIEGFAFAPGYRWRLLVERRDVPDPPADGSRYAYRLVRVLHRVPSGARPDEEGGVESRWTHARGYPVESIETGPPASAGRCC